MAASITSVKALPGTLAGTRPGLCPSGVAAHHAMPLGVLPSRTFPVSQSVGPGGLAKQRMCPNGRAKP